MNEKVFEVDKDALMYFWGHPILTLSREKLAFEEKERF